MRTSLFTALLVAALSFGCVTGPYDGEYTGWGAVDFDGWAYNEGGEVEIYAYNKNTANWALIGSATATTIPTTHNGDTLYSWHTTVTLDALPNWECYWDAGCDTSPEDTYSAQIYASEVDGPTQKLTTFDGDGRACVVDRLSEGMGWYAAGDRCKDLDSPYITIYSHHEW